MYTGKPGGCIFVMTYGDDPAVVAAGFCAAMREVPPGAGMAAAVTEFPAGRRIEGPPRAGTSVPSA